ncbi:hypothetical protein L1049_008960 [Liquidambar formosana]|uniref:Uncharacterized protein n=1 Tax=Liquidambar formosana TaxID=63359 RepID=A0AAP0X607_LIQFO
MQLSGFCAQKYAARGNLNLVLFRVLTLVISSCENLKSLEWEEDIRGLRFSLQVLYIRKLRQLVALPQWLQGSANSLQILHIEGCPGLKTLPEWLQNLTLLEKIEIRHCPQLSALPEGMQRLTALRQLKIYRCNPELTRRCKWKIGEDWPKVVHVPEITLEGKSDSESHSQPNDTQVPMAEYERLQQEIARSKDENKMLLDMVKKIACNKVLFKRHITFSNLCPICFNEPETVEHVLRDCEYAREFLAMVHPDTLSTSGLTLDAWILHNSWSQSADSEDESLERGIAYLEEENRALHDEVGSARSFADEAGSSGTAGVP